MTERSDAKTGGKNDDNTDDRTGGLVTTAQLAGAVGGGVAIALMVLFAGIAGLPVLSVPFATSIVLVLGTPDVEPAQPRALIGGHLVSTAVGLLVVKIAGPGLVAAAVAVGLAMLAMHLARAYHPPAGIDALIVGLNNLSFGFLLVPVAAGVVLLTAFAFIWHKASGQRPWPNAWW